MNYIISLAISAIFYLAFILWYGGKGKPLTEEETESLIQTIKKKSGIEGKEESDLLIGFRALAATDDGKEYLMVNLMKFKDTDPNSEAMRAHKRYSKRIVPLLFKRAGHPVFLSKVQGEFLKYDGSEEWDEVAIVRYRSRRDMLKMVAAAANENLGNEENDDKWISMKKTHVFPSRQSLRLGSVKLNFLLMMIIAGLILSLIV